MLGLSTEHGIGRGLLAVGTGGASEAYKYLTKKQKQAGPQVDQAQQQQEAGDAMQRADAERNRQAQLKAAKDYAESTSKQAREYREGLPQLQEKMYNPQADVMRRDLAGQIEGVQQGASSRGLLYSGLRQAGESSAAQGTAANMAAARQNINQQTQSQADMYDRMANQAQMGVQGAELGQYGNQQAMAQQQYQMANDQQQYQIGQDQQKQKNRSATLGLIGQAAGSAGGTALAAAKG